LITLEKTYDKYTYYRIEFSQKSDDLERVEAFCDALGIEKMYIRSVKKENGSVQKYIQIIAGRKDRKEGMAYDLINLGMEYTWSNEAGHRVKIPNFKKVVNECSKYDKDKLLAAFILGYYDGDGTLDSDKYCAIFSSHKPFLVDIKTELGLKNSILKIGSRETSFPDGSTAESTIYRLRIDLNYFQKMLGSYENTMQRKRPPKYRKTN